MKQEKTLKSPNLIMALVPIIVVVIFALASASTWGIGMHIPLIMGVIAAALIGAFLGAPWSKIQNGMVAGVSRTIVPMAILATVGLIVGGWLSGGVIQTLIYYGLKFISPMVFVPLAALVTGIVAISTGTSLGSIASVGLALTVMGSGMGLPAPLLVGAVISGAAFGDSMSPLSDSTNMASAMSGSDLFDLIGHAMKGGIPAFVISLVLYFVLGLQHASSISMDSPEIMELIGGLEASFNLNPVLMLVPVVTIVFSIKKAPALPSLLAVAGLGGLAALVFQGKNYVEVLGAMASGYTSTTGVATLDSMLTRGGISSMTGTMLLMFLAAAMGGMMEELGMLDAILHAVMKFVKTDGDLNLAAIVSGLVVIFSTGAQPIGIALPARLYAPAYKERDLDTTNLGRVALATGSACSPLVPWSVTGAFTASMLGVEALSYAMFAFFPMLVVLINVVYGYTGITMKKTKAE